MEWGLVIGSKEKTRRRVELIENNARLSDKFHAMYFNNEIILAPFLDRKINVSKDEDLKVFLRKFKEHLEGMVEAGFISNKGQVDLFFEYAEEGYYDSAFIRVVSKLLREPNKNLTALHSAVLKTKEMVSDCLTKIPTALNMTTTFDRLKGSSKSLLTTGVAYNPEMVKTLLGDLPTISKDEIKKYVEPTSVAGGVSEEETETIKARLEEIVNAYTQVERFLDSLLLAEQDEFKECELYFFSTESEQAKLDNRMEELAKEVTSMFITPYVITNSVSYAHLQRAFIANVYMSLKNKGEKREYENYEVLGKLISKYHALVKILYMSIGHKTGRTQVDFVLDRLRTGHPIPSNAEKMIDIYHDLCKETSKPHFYGVLDESTSTVMNVLHHLYFVVGSIIYHSGGRNHVLSSLNEVIYTHFVDASRLNPIHMRGGVEVFPFKVDDVIMKQCLMYDLQRIFVEIEDEKLLPTFNDIINTLAYRNSKANMYMQRSIGLSNDVHKVLGINDSLENNRDRLERILDNHHNDMTAIDISKNNIIF